MSSTLSPTGLKITAITDTIGQLISDLSTNFNIINKFYPIGAIYISVDSTNPSSFLGGTWARLEGVFLVGATSDNSTFKAGTSGGSSTQGIKPCGNEASGYGLTQAGGFQDRVLVNGLGYTDVNLPPYLAVYMWKRTA